MARSVPGGAPTWIVIVDTPITPFTVPHGSRHNLGRVLAHLLGAPDIPTFATRAADYLEGEGLTGVVMGWQIARGRMQVHEPGDLHVVDPALALAAREQGWAADDVAGRVACRITVDDGRYGLGLVANGTNASRPAIEEHVHVLAPLAAAIFEKTLLTGSLQQLEHSGQLQSALFAIADMASSDMDLGDMLRELHGIVGRFMYAENFYIALYDDVTDALRFIYLKDTIDPLVRDANEFIPMTVMESGLTWYLIRDKRPLMGAPNEIRRTVSGPTREIGLECFDWLGVPVMFGDRVRGVLVVQSYIERPRYTPADQALLTYVGSHILTAVDRKMAQEELESRVEQRTRELRRSVRLQETLFRIAELSHTATNLDEFYLAVHAIVGEFLDTRNFYIATLSEDGERLDFPYYVDQFRSHGTSRRLGRGLSEYVIRQRRPCLFDKTVPGSLAELQRLEATGEIVYSGPESTAWLGVPLVVGERVMGLLAVQSYTEGTGYTDRDRELLTFISYQVANGLERQRAAGELKNAYAELEGRVAERTVELSQQIEERERIEQRLKHQVLHDSLTGLPNRAYLRDQITRALAHRERDPHYRFAVLFMDLDRFKVINDSVGHLIGDGLLKEVAQRFSHCVRAGRDMVARLGGDEFAILMEVDGTDGAIRMAQRVIDALREPVRVEGKEIFSGVSVGIAMGSPDYTSPEELLRDADIAMYRAKAAGRHRFEVFDEELNDEALHLLETEGELRRGLIRHEFLPFFQPIVRLADAGVVGYEALMRWNHPERGMLAPGLFLPLAEAIGCMEALDWQLFDRAMQVIPQLLEPGQYVNLNFSPRHFRSSDLDLRFIALLEANSVQPSQVRIEVTEGALLENPEQVGRVFQRLRAHGVEVALDDFGTGYSSLSYLHRFQMHTLKIDRSFVGDLRREEEGSSTAVVRAILALSHSQRMEVVAEGIETEEQRQALIALGCNLGQGFFFARPCSLEDILAARLQTA
ncbi:MAG: EAL domain-containing protein [Lysobacter sp.]|nr:MAG: EAL domain-containing protein [Lysobacter sp.]